MHVRSYSANGEQMSRVDKGFGGNLCKGKLGKRCDAVCSKRMPFTSN